MLPPSMMVQSLLRMMPTSKVVLSGEPASATVVSDGPSRAVAERRSLQARPHSLKTGWNDVKQARTLVRTLIALACLALAGCSSPKDAPSDVPIFGQGGAVNEPGSGAAGNCAAGDPTCQMPAGCSGPTCVCAVGQTNCGGVCVSTSGNGSHCGVCGNACGASLVCSEGVCGASCAGSLEQVGNSCVTPLDNGVTAPPVGGPCTDDSACGTGLACVGGTCQCTGGLVTCGTTCANLSTDPLNCGTCGLQCGTGQCNSGVCPQGKACATTRLLSAPVITDFESYTSGTAPETWGFSFNAPAGQALTVYSGTYHFSDNTGMQTLQMVPGNGSTYAAGIANPNASAWGGGMGLWMSCIDASPFDGLAFDVRGNVPGGRASVSLSMESTSAPDMNDANAGGTCLAGCQAPLMEFPVGAGWTRVLLPWSEFTPGSANQATVAADGKNITGLSFSLALEWGEVAGAAGTYGPEAASFEFVVDNIGFFETEQLCPADQRICDSQCVDVETSNAHCGGCGNTCTGGAVCGGSEAGCVCPSGLTFCAGSCVDLTTDTSHCGECSNFCAIGSSCSQGTCSGGFGTTSNRCGEATRLLGNPLGCSFGWGANPDNAIPNFLSFASKWVGYEPNPNTRCDGCTWLESYGNSNVVPLYIAYFTAYRANMEAGLGDCNLDNNGNLCTGGAQFIRDNRARLIAMYESYAQRSYAAYPNRPVIWVIEPDLSQYAEGQSGNPLSMADLGGYTADIICAIKTNMPNAVIALNHSTWLTGAQTRAFWSAMPLDLVDLLHITSAANIPGGYFNDTDANNREEGTFRFLSQLTGKSILADTSFGITTMQDSWSTATAATLNQRIADGVVGVLIYPTPGDYAQRIGALGGLTSTCQ